MKGILLVLCAVLFTITVVHAQSGATDCEYAFLDMLQGRTTNIETIQMLDYTGKAMNDMGNYDGCLSLNQSFAHYCVMETTITVKMANEHLSSYVGLCVPAICDSADLAALLTDFLQNPKWNLSTRFDLGDELTSLVVNCDPGHETKPTVGLVITVGLIVILVLLTIGGTYLESVPTRKVEYRPLRNANTHEDDTDARPLLSEQHNGDEESSGSPQPQRSLRSLPTSSKRSKLTLIQDLVKCFGLRANFKFLLADNRASEPSLACLNSLRTIGMMWVVLGHTLTYMVAPVGYDNLMTVKDLVGRVSFQVVPGAELSVDVFFYLSGFLVVYMVLKELKLKGKVPWVLFYFHRYVRLTPVYGFIILVYATVTPFMVSGPFHFLYRPTKTELCDKYWWSNMLYINNFYPSSSSDQCLGWSWYLANDMQFYIFTPIIIIAYRKSKRLGWMLVTCLITLCLCFNASLSYIYELVPLDPNNNKFNTIIYNKPYTRMAPYLIGIAAAFLLQEEHTDLSHNRFVRWIGWLVSFVITTCATYLTVGFWRHGWNLLQDVMYMTFARTGFTMATAWLMYTFHKGHGGFLRELSSLYLWVPLARLTYNVYLVHPIVIFIINYSTTTTFHYSDSYSAVRYSSNIMIAYFVGLIVHLLVEKPTSNIERVLLPSRGKK